MCLGRRKSAEINVMLHLDLILTDEMKLKNACTVQQMLIGQKHEHSME